MSESLDESDPERLEIDLKEEKELLEKSYDTPDEDEVAVLEDLSKLSVDPLPKMVRKVVDQSPGELIRIIPLPNYANLAVMYDEDGNRMLVEKPVPVTASITDEALLSELESYPARIEVAEMPEIRKPSLTNACSQTKVTINHKKASVESMDTTEDPKTTDGQQKTSEVKMRGSDVPAPVKTTKSKQKKSSNPKTATVGSDVPPPPSSKPKVPTKSSVTASKDGTCSKKDSTGSDQESILAMVLKRVEHLESELKEARGSDSKRKRSPSRSKKSKRAKRSRNRSPSRAEHGQAADRGSGPNRSKERESRP